MEPTPDTVRPAHIPVPSKQPAPDEDHSLDSLHQGIMSLETSAIETSVLQTPGAEPSVEILEIIFDYALNKFSDTKQRLEAGRPKFLSVIERFIAAGARVEMCLPAFPFKSANKIYKVLGVLPDKAEEIGLERLNKMCLRIGEIYTPGARCTIISDGLVYNGLSNAD